MNPKGWPGNNPIGEPGAEIKVKSLGNRYGALEVHARGKLQWYVADTGHHGRDALHAAPWTVTCMAPGKDAYHAIAATGIQPANLSRSINKTRLWSVDLRTLKRTEIGTAPGFLSPCGVSDNGGWLISIRNEEMNGGHTFVATNLASMKTLSFGSMLGFELAPP